MASVSLGFLELLELTEDECGRNVTIALELGDGMREDLPHPLYLPHLLDRLFDQLPVAQAQQWCAASLTSRWNDSACAADYLEVLREAIPLLRARLCDQLAHVSQLETQIDIASTQAQRHKIYIDQETARGNLSTEARDRYQRDAKKYENTHSKIDLYLRHHRHIGELRKDTLTTVHELVKLLDEADGIDTRAETIDEAENRSYSNHDRMNGQLYGGVHAVPLQDERTIDADFKEVTLSCRVIGRMVNALLDAERREYLQIGLKLEGWGE